MEGEIEAMTDLTLVTGAGEGDQQQICEKFHVLTYFGLL